MQLFTPKYEVDQCINEIRKVLESGWTGCGPACRKFEQEWSNYVQAKESLYLNSATSALHIAVHICDLPPKSPILTTALTFASTNAVILYENHFPVFVDINEDDFSLDSKDFLRKKEEFDAQAAIWVHYAGNVSPHFYQIQKNITPKFSLIEDCAHAAGARYLNGDKVGSSQSTLSCFSYHSVKNLPTFDSGMLCSSFTEKMHRARKLSWLGIDKDTFSRTSSDAKELYKWRYDITELGWKYNGNDIAASIGLVQLQYLDRDNAYRHQLNTWYTENLINSPHIRMMNHQIGSSNHLMVIRVANRNEVLTALRDNGIAPGVHYLPNNEFPIFQKYYTKGSCPNLERISEELISLPNHLHLSKADVDRVCEVVCGSARS